MITSSCWQFICFCNPLPWVFLILQSSLIYHNLPAELWLSCLVGQSQIFHEPCCTTDFSVVDHLMSLTFNKCHIINHNPSLSNISGLPEPFSSEISFQPSDTQSRNVYISMAYISMRIHSSPPLFCWFSASLLFLCLSEWNVLLIFSA